MSNTDRVLLSIAEEATFGTAPTGSGAFTDLRFTGESLRLDTQSIASNEIRDDRMVAEHVRSSLSAAGATNFELSYGTMDVLLEAALFSADWSTGDSVSASTISFAVSGSGVQVISDSASGFGSITLGQWVKVSGAAESVNNGIFKVTASAAGEITITNSAGIVESAGASVVIKELDQIVNGVDQRFFSIERQYADLSGLGSFVLFEGMVPDQLSLNITAEQLITGSVEWMGKRETSASAQVASANVPVNSNEIMNAIDHISGVLSGPTYSALEITSLTLQVQNNLRSRNVVGEVGPESFGAGRTTVSGTLQIYLQDSALIDKYLAWTGDNVGVKIQDDAGNVYVIDLPQIKFTSGQRVAGGVNQDIIASFDFVSERHSTEDIVIRICRENAS